MTSLQCKLVAAKAIQDRLFADYQAGKPIKRFTEACFRASISRHFARNVTRLWNWVDHQDAPEDYWAYMQIVFPSMFDGPTANNFKFTY